jgi:tRNA pseudouridine38-40 synthase
MKLAFRFSYIGERFFGSQMQPGLRTVEGEIVAACRRLGLFDDWRAAAFATAGRTDRGVHARSQVCSFRTDFADRAIHTLNLMLPPDIWCTAWAEVPDHFHPRYDALSRTYRYYFSPVPGDIEAMNDAARVFIGRHDFSSFARIGDRNPIRIVREARVWRESAFAIFEVTAESFLWNMVRCMATALERVGKGKIDPDAISRLLMAHSGERLPAARPEGLILWNVEYDIGFIPLQIDSKSNRYLSDTHHYHALMARISRVMSGGSDRSDRVGYQ